MPGATCLLKVANKKWWRLASVPSGQGIAMSSAADLLSSSSDFIDTDMFVNCKWVDTRWQ